MSRTRIAGVEIDRLTPRDAVDRIVASRAYPRPAHRDDAQCRSHASLCEAIALPQRVCHRQPGSDGWHAVGLGQAVSETRLFLGVLRAPIWSNRCWRRPSAKTSRFSFSAPCRETLELALRRCALDFPRLRIAGAHAPPLHFEHDMTQDAACVSAIRDARPDIVFLALGTPKQELWIARHRKELDFGVALCVGAGIDYFAGVQRRCPKFLARIGAEWIWRLLSEPKRLGRRYAQCLLFMPGIGLGAD